MFLKNSRYKDARQFEAGDDGSIACKGTRPREIGTATGVVEHVIQEGDRLDLLARQKSRRSTGVVLKEEVRRLFRVNLSMDFSLQINLICFLERIVGRFY